MNGRLNQQQQLDLQRPPKPPAPPLGGQPRRRGMKFWMVIAAVVFALYVFGGPFILREELQWATISGQLLGTSEKAATKAALTARIDQAAQTATAAEIAKVAPTLDIERGRVQLDIERQTALAQIEIAKSAEIARQLAQIDLTKQAGLAKVQADAAVRSSEAAAYQSCLERARVSSANSNGPPGASLAGQIAARELDYATGAALCDERVKAQQETARATADAVAYPTP
jgi:hypothetical protein